MAGKEPIKLILKDGFEEFRPKFLVNDNVYNEIVQNNSVMQLKCKVVPFIIVENMACILK